MVALGGGGVHMSEAQTLGYVGVCDSPVDADACAVRDRPRGEREGLSGLTEGEGVGMCVTRASHQAHWAMWGYDSPVDADGSAVRHRPRGEGEGLPSLAQGEGVGGGVDEHGDGANGREGHLVVER